MNRLLLLAILLGVSACSSTGRRVVFSNTLGMPFVQVAGVAPLVCVNEVRVSDFDAFLKATGGKHLEAGFHQTGQHPVVNVTWPEAKAFCAWLGQKEGRRYRLPTDAEWSEVIGIRRLEKPGLAPKDEPQLAGIHPWGKGPAFKGAGNYCDAAFVRQGYGDSGMGGYDDGYGATSPVGRFKPDAHGIYDLAGNVWEWCEDWYDPPANTQKVLRGGAWRTGSEARLLSSFRGPDPPQAQLDSVGFRVVVER